MIKYSFTCKSNQWPPRLKKIDMLLKKIIKLKDDLHFKKNIDYDCNLILTNDKLIKKMNLQFRKINKSTDVLTFVSNVNINMKKPRKICDIFLSAETILKDSKINEINFYDHLTHIIVHSFLHINGFVHKKINDFVQMKKEEIKILKKLSISNPYLL